MKTTIGEFIRKKRVDSDLTLIDLKERTGVSNSHLSRIERGLRKPSPEILKKIAPALNASYNNLLEVAGYLESNKSADKIKSALYDDPELVDFWDKLSQREDLKLLFKQTKDMSPEGVKRIIRIIKAIEEEEQG